MSRNLKYKMQEIEQPVIELENIQVLLHCKQPTEPQSVDQESRMKTPPKERKPEKIY